MIGQFAMGNQVTFFIPYIFNYTNASWKTQKYTRLLLDTWFQDTIFGVPGDEDGGSMSSFVVFSAMGFYPTTPGIPRYSITRPALHQDHHRPTQRQKIYLISPQLLASQQVHPVGYDER